jgi:hypothetical protein
VAKDTLTPGGFFPESFYRISASAIGTENKHAKQEDLGAYRFAYTVMALGLQDVGVIESGAFGAGAGAGAEVVGAVRGDVRC